MKKITVILFLQALLFGCGGGGGSSSDDDETASGTANAGIDVVGNCTLSEDEEALLVAHNAARAEARLCGSDSMEVVAPLAWHCLLGESSIGHSEDMAQNNFFSHTGSDGLSPFDRMVNVGYDNFTTAGENIFAGSADVDQAMAGWLSSPGHCRNIMNSSYTEMGAGYGQSNTSQFGVYLTANFGAR